MRVDIPATVTFARALRRQGNRAEAALWSRLRNRQLGVKFRRQQPIGPYIVDFACFEKRMIVEVDGSQHNDEEGMRKDENRTAWLQGRGYTVMRFWSNDVLSNPADVCQAIALGLCCTPPSPSPQPSPVKREGAIGQGLASS
ncbi:MAG: endonuclease domain-containing protein [Chloroflexi bacterium]|nr:endonuclease domain-containing protein [Chloroflexota bacterium]